MDKNGQYSNWNPRIPVFYAVFAAAFFIFYWELSHTARYTCTTITASAESAKA